MRILSFAVGVFAVATFLIGLRTPDVAVFLLAAVALGCGVTTFFSQRISIFLKVFNAIFAVETITFGLAFLVDHLGLWPKAYADYTLPDSLPFAVALFGCLTFGLSFIPVVRKMTDIADPYFNAALPTSARIWPFPSFIVAQNRLAKAALVFLIVVNQMQVAIEVRLSFFSRDFYNALQNKDLAQFWFQLIWVFLPFASIRMASLRHGHGRLSPLGAIARREDTPGGRGRPRRRSICRTRASCRECIRGYSDLDYFTAEDAKNAEMREARGVWQKVAHVRRRSVSPYSLFSLRDLRVLCGSMNYPGQHDGCIDH